LTGLLLEGLEDVWVLPLADNSAMPEFKAAPALIRGDDLEDAADDGFLVRDCLSCRR
jgi:hypothetical protein